MPEASFYILIPCIKVEIDQPWISIQTTHMQVLINLLPLGLETVINFLNHAHL